MKQWHQRRLGLCAVCGQRLPIATPSWNHAGLVYEGHQKCSTVNFISREAPEEPFNRLYPLSCVNRFIGYSELSAQIMRSNLEHRTLKIGDREIKCVTFEEIIRHSANRIQRGEGTASSSQRSRNRTFRRLDDVERLCFLDSAKFRKIWEHQEKEKS